MDPPGYPRAEGVTEEGEEVGFNRMDIDIEYIQSPLQGTSILSISSSTLTRKPDPLL